MGKFGWGLASLDRDWTNEFGQVLDSIWASLDGVWQVWTGFGRVWTGFGQVWTGFR